MPDDAGSPIISYTIQYKLESEESYKDLVTNYNQLSFKMTTNVTEGEKYMFIAKAVNKWGIAELWSNPTTIYAATVPNQVTNVT